MSEDLFHKKGFIHVKEYVRNIEDGFSFKWKLNMRFIDKIHFVFLKLISKYSWFSDYLYILHDSTVSPSYSLLLSRLKKQNFFDTFIEKKIRVRGYTSFYLEKKITIGNRIYYMSGQGVSLNKEKSISIAIGELLERTITGLYDLNKNIIISSVKNLEGDGNFAYYPPKYHQYLNIQKERYKELQSDPLEKIPWVKGRNLITKETVYIPRAITSWFTENRSRNKILLHATTNGSAGYFNKSGAILRGLLEVIQRDGFLVHWLTQIPPDVIRKDSLPNYIQEKIVSNFESYGLTIYILNITALSVPSVLIVAISKESEVPQIVVSAASSLTFEEAILSALEEMVLASEMFYFFDERPLSYANEKKFEPFVSNYGKIERQFYWRGKDKVNQFEWFLEGKQIDFNDLEDILSENSDHKRLLTCLNILKKYGEEYYPLIYEPKNLIQEELGFYIVQVFIPMAFPFYLSESRAPFQSKRLHDFAAQKKVNKWNLNPLPHMFS